MIIDGITVAVLLGAGGGALIIAIVNERRMQRQRQPGVSYWDVTLRRDGAWRKTELFTDAGLVYQRRAAKWGMIGVACIVAGLIMKALS